MFSKIKKRDGSIVKFKVSKVISAIEKTMLAVHIEDEELPKKIAERIVEEAEKIVGEDHILTVEEMQDIVEKVLITEGHAEMAKAYILYRQKRTELRKLKENILGRMDDSKLDVNGLLVAKSRYLLKDEEGSIIESPKEMFKRISISVSQVEKGYKKKSDEIEELEEEFYDVMSSLEFIPSGRILANAGTDNKMLYSSFVIPIKDSMDGIFKALYEKAQVQKLGGGTGFSFSRLRPKGSTISTQGSAAGPIAFIKLFDHSSELSVLGSRKPANMGSLSVDHPDIIEFITMKERGELKNFNISVEITDAFMNAVKENGTYNLIDPNTKKVVDTVDANNMFHLIVTMAWRTGDPGVLFIDRINEANPLPGIARIETTDPCGDQLLLPYDGGNLGALNLSVFVRNQKIQWKQLENATNLAVRFLDNIIDISEFPVKKIDDMVKGNRRIGLGIMGFADMLYKLNVPYNSEKAIETAEKVMKFISTTAKGASEKLAEERGVFPYWEKSIYNGRMNLRNCSLLAIAPTGSRSILANTSPGIEPNFALGYLRKVSGNEILQINPVLEQALKDKELYSEELIRKIIKTGKLNDMDLPADIKEVFVTAYDINPEWHIRIQATFQRHIDNAISKTINFPRNATIEEVKKAFMMAYETGCRGMTVYRDGSLSGQVITIGI
jgi:ribonucleoside-diphosphate reductase alpha chain